MTWNGTNQSDGAAQRSAFTLIELLVVAAMVAVLVSILLPGLGAARAVAHRAVCGSNIRQLALANAGYAAENGGRYCPGAIAIRTRNLHRWHGTRENQNEPFVAAGGPLTPYLTANEGIRACPSFRGFTGEGPGAFERGNGGYGYNQTYLGRIMTSAGDSYSVATDAYGMTSDRVRRPGETIMFADAAFAGDAGLIEYSFAEPRFHAEYLPLHFRPDPSIHFRHRRVANVAWADTHVSAERRTFTYRSGLYRGDPAPQNIGWFGAADDNTLFDID